ncbi:hypothetical protein Cyrtocomes_01021 [Candidatus Cyrtobacter comes]|uniref:Uncharacterized protein n=1 Tax=Candidatus Cyrtobacter comes TaxID=675776 RepID=A0ABU5L936_9RICK|nr:hypothetical protein [Candidatus Cyrtobacter comes]MDZ5762630.1 hypothetical protein [Candidatus Cyrtobacter comes]
MGHSNNNADDVCTYITQIAVAFSKSAEKGIFFLKSAIRPESQDSNKSFDDLISSMRHGLAPQGELLDKVIDNMILLRKLCAAHGSSRVIAEKEIKKIEDYVAILTRKSL